jgi:hypothetical protein
MNREKAAFDDIGKVKACSLLLDVTTLDYSESLSFEHSFLCIACSRLPNRKRTLSLMRF